jgi:hypothetical protein
MLVSCGSKNNPLKTRAPQAGTVRVAAIIARPASLAKAQSVEQTVWTRIIIRISAPDMDPLSDTTNISTSQTALVKSISKVRAGNGRQVEAWTENASNGKIIHTSTSQSVNVSENAISDLSVELKPIKGSIYFDFWNIDTRIDTVEALFISGTDTMKARGGKAPGSRITLCIDYIPDGTNGTIRVYGIDCGTSPWDTLYRYGQAYFFKADADSSFHASFKVYPGSVNFSITFNLPGVTVVQGYMNDTQALDSTEQGPVYISEIMYAVDDSEYIEIYNPLSKDTTFDTLILEVNDVYRRFFNITVPADSLFVIGRKALPFADTYHATASALDLASTGEFIALRKKDSTLMDCVYFTGSNSTQEWPAVSSSQRASIVLDSLGGPAYNNYGKHWTAAITPVPGTGLKGTPRTRGR